MHQVLDQVDLEVDAFSVDLFDSIIITVFVSIAGRPVIARK